jgi:hypothetical protein
VKRFIDPKVAEYVTECITPLKEWDIPKLSYPLTITTHVQKVNYLISKGKRPQSLSNKLRRCYEIGRLFYQMNQKEEDQVARLQNWTKKQAMKNIWGYERIFKTFSACGLNYIYQVKLLTPAIISRMATADFLIFLEDITPNRGTPEEEDEIVPFTPSSIPTPPKVSSPLPETPNPPSPPSS